MNKLKSKNLELEILLSTMLKTDFYFLEKMFPHESFSNYKILIINQTTKDKILTSNYKNIKVINSFEFGVPKSRNLAINNATGDICLMTDDDVVYMSNLKNNILEAYNRNPLIDMISFEAVNEDGKLYAKYPHAGVHNKKTLKKIYTWVISFRRKSYKEKGIFYNNNFGFGATFKGGEEYIFLRNAYDVGMKMIHERKTIVMHPEESSGRHMGSDNIFFSKAAASQRFFGNLSYVWLLKYTLYMWRFGYINFNELHKKFKIGLQGISTYKTLKAKGNIDRINGN